VPNWCYNYLDISGDETLIADIKRQLNKPFVKDHDSWNATTGQMEVSQTAYSNPVFAFHNIYNHIQDGISDEEYLKQPDHSLPLEESLMFKGNLNGFITTVEDYGSKCRDCDSLDTLEYCENDCGEICSDCNYMGEADLDCVAECDIHKVYLDDEHVPEYRRVDK